MATDSISILREPSFFRLCSSLLILAALLFCASPLQAAQQKSVQSQPQAAQSNKAADTPAAKQMDARAGIKAQATPIAVAHEGTDSLGAKLSYQLKEIFNSGTLFALNDKDEPKLQLIITTASEFPSRPGVGSVYSVVWLYTERSSVLSNYLAHEVGAFSADTLQELADRLAERTSGLAAKHSYIFRK